MLRAHDCLTFCEALPVGLASFTLSPSICVQENSVRFNHNWPFTSSKSCITAIRSQARRRTRKEFGCPLLIFHGQAGGRKKSYKIQMASQLKVRPKSTRCSRENSG